jgi:hypothetical protein
MGDIIATLLYNLILLLFGTLGGIAARLLWLKLGTENASKLQKFLDNTQIQLDTKNRLAITAVKFAEQEGIDLKLKGKQKLNKAIKNMVAQANDAGINVTEDEAYTLIKATLREVKDRYGEEWAGALEESENDEDPDGEPVT